MSHTKKILLVLGASGTVPILMFILFAYSVYHLDTDREIIGQVTISSAWVEITPQPPLKPEQQTQSIVLSLEDPLSLAYAEHGRVEFHDGTTANIEVQLIDRDGTIYDLTSTDIDHALRLTFAYDRSAGTRLPQDRVYRSVRIRSDKPIRCRRIIWHGHTGK